MKGVGTVVTMGVVYWLCYGMAVMIAMAIFGFLVVCLAGIVGFIYYLANIKKCVQRRDFDGAATLLLAPALLAGVSLLATLIWYVGGPSFTTSFAAHFYGGQESGGDNVILFVFGCIALLGWAVPLVYAHEYAMNPDNRNRSAGNWFDQLMMNRTAICLTAIVWGIVGGSSFAIGALANLPN